MKFIRCWVASLALAAAFFGGGQALVGDEKKPAVGDFGAIAVASEETAQAQAKSWLKGTKADAATVRQFETLWKQSHRSVLDRVADSLALGNADAAKLLTAANNAQKPIPAFADDAKTVKAPALLTDNKQPAFFRNNLALAYAQRLIHRGVYEEALAALKTTSAAKVVDPASYLFHRAVCEHGTLQQKEATETINRLLEEVVGSPERYKTVAVLMLLDMQTWKDKDLASVARQMKNVERRLQLARGGPKTQGLQRKIVFRLDELIKKLEKKQKDQQGGGGWPNGGGWPSGGQPSGGPPAGNNPSSPATDSFLPQIGGEGTVKEARLRKLAGEWGRLPERERNRILQDLTRGMSSSHREAVENYFRRLTESQR